MQVKKAKAKDKPYKLSDSKGLYLQVHPNGSKYWRYKFRYNGKENVYSIGVADEISLLEARQKHQEARQLLKQGINPNEHKKTLKIRQEMAAENNFQNVAEQWHRAKYNTWDRKHAAKLWRSLELHAFPYFGNQPITDIKPRVILHAIRKLEEKGATDLSHRVLQRVSGVFQYAIHSDLAEFNPAAELRGALKAHKGKHLPAITAKELPEFFKRLEVVSTSRLNKLAIKFLMLTFVRQCEMRPAKWEEFDFDNALWTVPKENTKMKRQPHLVPLATQTTDLLREIHDISGQSVYLFPSQNRQKNPYMSDGTITRALKRMGYKDKMVGHGFRSLATTELNEQGFPPDVIERQMQHQEQNKVRAAYHRAEYMPQRVDMMQKWADFIDLHESNV